MNTVMWELGEGVAERKTPRHGSLIDASKAAAFCASASSASHSKTFLTTTASYGATALI
jgi:hypothetical protein